jgi:hypothetical protein
MYIFAEPMSEDEINEIQKTNKQDLADFLKSLEHKLQKHKGSLVVKDEFDEEAFKEEETKVEGNDAIEAESTNVEDVGGEAESGNDATLKNMVDMEGQDEVLPLPEVMEDEANQELETGESAVTMANGDEEANQVEGIEGEDPDRVLDLESGVEKGYEGVDGEDEIKTETGETTVTMASGDEETNQVEDIEEAGEDPDRALDLEPDVEKGYEGVDGEDEIKTETEESIVSQTSPPEPERRELLGMTLTAQNFVNGRIISRPSVLGPTDKWTVKYTLVEAKTQDSAWITYNAVKKRRKNAVSRRLLTEEDENKNISGYVRYLRKLSKEGRVWATTKDNENGEPVTYKPERSDVD